MPAIDAQLISGCRSLCGSPIRCVDSQRNLKVADDGVLKRTRGKDSIPARRRILSDSANAFDDMLDIRAL